MIKKHIMMLAVEELEKEELAAAVAQIETETPVDNPEEHPDVTAVTQAEGDIDQHLDEIAEVVADLGDVEAIAEFTEETAAQGGADTVTAEILQIGAESLYERLGVRPSKVVLSTENFGSKMSKLEGTTLAVEGFKEFIKTMWEAIKAAFKKMGQYLAHYVQMVFNLNTYTIKAANELNSNLKRKPITGSNKAFSSDKKLTVNVAGFMYSLISPDGQENVGSLTENLQKSTLTFAKSAKMVNTFTSYLSSTAELKDLIKDEESFNGIKFPDLSESFQESSADLLTKIFNKRDVNKNYYKSENMIGARAIYVIEPKDSKGKTGKEAIDAVANTKIQLAGIQDERAPVNGDAGAYKMTALEPMQYAEMIKTVIFVCEKIAGSERGYLDLVLKHDQMIKEIEAVEQLLTQNEQDYAQYKTRVAGIRIYANNINRLTGEMIKAVAGSLTKACHTTVVYMSQSYHAYLRYQ
jgi:hypothetical protein